MKLSYIGTGAADWTKEAGARDGVLRRFTCTLLDEEVLIDLAPTTPHELFAAGGALGQVTDVLYTHSHDDHYDYETLVSLAKEHPIHVWAESAFANRIPMCERLTIHPMHVGVTYQVGRYTVLPLAANHGIRQHPEERALHYIISDGEKRMFWGADGAWLLTETWRAILKNKPYDRMILDGTLGEVVGDMRIFEHNSLAMIRAMRDVFLSTNCLTENGQVWLTHLARDPHDSPKILKEKCLADGLYVAEDELEDLF